MIRILVIDDQTTIREGLKAILESEPDLVVVGTARDGKSGIEQVALLQPDVVLIDMEMPGMDGVKTTEIICQNYIGAKIIILSCYDSDEYVSKSLRAGAMGYLLKNTPAVELKEAIRFVYRGYAQIGPGLLGKVVSQVTEFDSNLPQTNSSQLKEQNALSLPIKTANLHFPDLENELSLSHFYRSWKFYLGIWLVGNILIWTIALAYLKFKDPIYKSEWAISLPVGKSSTSVNLPEISNADFQRDSPLSNSEVSDRLRENYRFLAETREVREAAASQLNISVQELGKPRIKIMDNTTLMKFEIHGNTPQEAYEKALAFQNALEVRLNQLREKEIGQQNWQLLATLDSSKRQLQEAHKLLSEYKARAPFSSREQLQNLSANIEDLRRQKVETLAKLQQISASSKELSANLGLSAQEALEQLSLNNKSLNSNKANLLQELVLLHTQQQGLQNQAQELERQIKNLEIRLSSFSAQELTLANLNRDVQIAETTFSSTMTKLDSSKSDIFASYPRIQLVTEPNMPKEPDSPETKFVLLSSSVGSFFLTTGLFSLWWRDRCNQQAI